LDFDAVERIKQINAKTLINLSFKHKKQKLQAKIDRLEEIKS
jgi:hypothetical protein